MNFDNTPPKWDAQGTEPSADLQEKGFAAGYKPPAPYFNYLFNKITACLKELQTKLSGTDTKADNIANTHRVNTYVSFSEIGVTYGEETIEDIATGMPSNSELLVTIGADNAEIYPQTYGVLKVTKKDNTRVIFEFYAKTSTYKYLGVYDSTMETTWSGWVYELGEADVVDSLTSTSTKAPLSANQGKVLNEKLTAHTSSTSNPHAVTKAQVGLGNVPNVATNDQTPTYTAASSNTALKSGEKLSVAMGKIAKAVSSLISHLANTSNPHSVTKSQVGLGNVDNTADANKSVKYATSAGSATKATQDASGNVITSTYAKAADLTAHTGNKSNPHGVTKAQVGLGNVPNVATNDQTPTYSDTTTLATLSSGEKLNVAFQKIKLAITSLINHINSHRINTYVSFADIGVTIGSETIEGIATKLPSNSELLVTIGEDNAEIYPQTYGVLHVLKKDGTRTVFKFYNKSIAYEYLGVYDSAVTTKWSGWVYSLSGSDVVDSLTSTSTNTPLSAKQGKVLNEKLAAHTSSKSNPHAVTKAQVGLGNVDNTADASKPVSTAQATAIADAKAAGTSAQTNLTTHTNNKSNPHGVTKSQVGLGNVPNVATNDQTPTYSTTTTLATLKSGEKLNVALQKIQYAITSLINHINAHKISTYVSFSEISVTTGSETIETIATKLPSNSELLVTIGADNAAIYPQSYGVLHVIKKDATRTVFKFYSKTTAYEYLGIYDNSQTTKWSGWVYSLSGSDVVDSLKNTSTNVPLSAKQGKVLNEKTTYASNGGGYMDVNSNGEIFSRLVGASSSGENPIEVKTVVQAHDKVLEALGYTGYQPINLTNPNSYVASVVGGYIQIGKIVVFSFRYKMATSTTGAAGTFKTTALPTPARACVVPSRYTANGSLGTYVSLTDGYFQPNGSHTANAEYDASGAYIIN